MADTAPYEIVLEKSTEALAANATGATIIGEAPFAGTVTAVTYTPESDITGADTNTRTLAVVNKGTDGNGSTSVATLALTSGVNATDFDEKALTLSGTAANLEVAAGDILAFTSTHAGTGLADPGGRIAVTISRS